MTTSTLTDLNPRKLLRGIIARKDKDGLHAWILFYFKVDIPRVRVCNDHDAPFDFVADYIFDGFKSAVVLANRSGGKTYIFGVLDAIMSYLNDDCEIATVGAIQNQAQRCYEYFKGFMRLFPFGREVQEQSMKRTTLANGSKVEIVTGTVSGVNSPHPQLLFIDEIDLMLWFVLQQAFSMPQSKNGIESKVVTTSTRKFPSGVMQRAIDEAKTDPDTHLYQWCIWEVVEAMPTDEKLLARINDKFAGQLPENIGKANGYYKWSDLIVKRGKLDDEVWEAEWLCRKPGLEGVIYGSVYSEDENMIDWSPPDHGGYVYLFEDFGNVESHPDVVLFAWVPYDYHKMIIFDELYMVGYDTEDIWQAVEGKLAEYGLIMRNVKGWVGDYHGITEIADRKRKGAPMTDKHPEAKRYEVNNGIRMVKNIFKTGHLFVSRRCRELHMELLGYKRKKGLDGRYSLVPVKDNDHGPDALRYGIVLLYDLLITRIRASIENKDKIVPAAKPIVTKRTGSTVVGNLRNKEL